MLALASSFFQISKIIYVWAGAGYWESYIDTREESCTINRLILRILGFSRPLPSSHFCYSSFMREKLQYVEFHGHATSGSNCDLSASNKEIMVIVV